MNRTKTILLLAAALLAVACATPSPLPPVVTPTGDDRYLADPRIGSPDPIPAAAEQRFEAAWRYILAGNETEARRALADVRKRAPGLAAADLAEVALDLRAGRLDEARRRVATIRQQHPGYTAARAYEAEVAFREANRRAAYDLYRDLAAQPDAPLVARERAAALEEQMFAELVSSASAAQDAEATQFLREALALRPDAVEPRVELARRLIAQKQWDEARRELDPLLDLVADRPDVQELLAEIEAGRGRYQDAIVRYDRLARRTRDPRHQTRLEEIKREWSFANMPRHYRDAIGTDAITRADLAILLYWTVPPVRFAQNLATPPIATDVEVDGREEIIRAIALGLFDVDPVTRRVNPGRLVPASRFSTHLARVLALRGAPCARGVATENVLEACGIPDPLATRAADAPITGAEAQRAFELVAKAMQ